MSRPLVQLFTTFCSRDERLEKVLVGCDIVADVTSVLMVHNVERKDHESTIENPEAPSTFSMDASCF